MQTGAVLAGLPFIRKQFVRPELLAAVPDGENHDALRFDAIDEAIRSDAREAIGMRDSTTTGLLASTT